MEERRRDYLEIHSKIADLMSRIALIEQNISYLRKFADKDRSEIERWVDSLKKHNASLMHLQGYEDRLEKSVTEIRDGVSKMSNRISKLENWRWLIIGALGIISFALPMMFRMMLLHYEKIHDHISHPLVQPYSNNNNNNSNF